MAFCKKCGAKIPAEAEFCPECGARVTETLAEVHRGHPAPKQVRRGFRIAGGVLIIVASSIFAFLVIVEAFNLVVMSGYMEVTVGVWIGDLFVFAFGLAGGVLTLVRKAFALAIFGTAFLMVGGILAFFPVHVLGTPSRSAGEIGLPVVLFSLLGLIFHCCGLFKFQRIVEFQPFAGHKATI